MDIIITVAFGHFFDALEQWQQWLTTNTTTKTISVKNKKRKGC
jgi:hypothetical protein